jgi:hypothetical protein
LPYAMTDPVAVMLPIHAPRYREMLWNASACPVCVMKSPAAVARAASPTSEWNAATAWGSSVGPILVDIP